MSKFTVAVIGDFMIDRYWIGKAERISPEAPIPVVKIEEMKEFLGGAGNVAANLEALGCEVRVFNPRWMPQPIKNRLMVDDHQIARWDERDVCWPYGSTLNFDSGNFDAIVVADYNKGGITKEIIEWITKHKYPIFVDTKRDPSIWSGVATAVFPNTKEWEQFHQQYIDFSGIVVLKQGKYGISLSEANHIKPIVSPSQARFVRSVNGAGDTVIAAFVYKWLALGGNHQLETYRTQCDNCFVEMLDFANAAAAVSVEHPYTYAPTLKEVEDRYYGIS